MAKPKKKLVHLSLTDDTSDRLRQIKSIIALKHTDDRITVDDVQNILIDAYLDRYPEFQQYLKNEALATNQTRS
ncbi:hypothetical protein [Herpetosiphon gulosus]|uniref:Uncharacterized protein n=1 Tax=Herpetosiphon gulosus TaxID=1973496 RepID=A0ABP9X080_9CHLR